MKFHKYQHIMKLGTDEVDGILDGAVYLFYKIDGTNSQVFLKDDGETLGFGSRNKEITPENDNAGFALSITQNKELYNGLLAILKAHPNYIIYGEWLVPHTLKTYAQNAWRKFYIFDVLDESTRRYLPYPYANMFKDCSQCSVIPLICIMDHPTPDQVKEKLQQTGEFLCASGLGEGIVIKNYDYFNKYGDQTWAKVLTEDFLGQKKDLRSANREIKDGMAQNATEHMIINKYLTDDHISKEYSKVCEKYGETVLDPRHTYELLNRVFIEFWSDNWEIILNKMHFPTVNFKALKVLCDARTKEVVATIER
mgnify:FL=1